MNIFIQQFESVEWFDLVLVYLVQSEQINNIILFVEDQIVVQNSQTFQVIRKYFGQKYELINSKVKVWKKDDDLEPLFQEYSSNKESNILIQINYQENDYVKQVKQTLNSLEGNKNFFNQLQSQVIKKYFETVICINNIYQQHLFQQLIMNKKQKQIMMNVGFVGPCEKFPMAGWFYENSFLNQFILCVIESEGFKLKTKSQLMFNIVPNDVLAVLIKQVVENTQKYESNVYVVPKNSKFLLEQIIKIIEQQKQMTYKDQNNYLKYFFEHYNKKKIFNGAYDRINYIKNSILGKISHKYKMDMAEQQYMIEKHRMLKQSLERLMKYEKQLELVSIKHQSQNLQDRIMVYEIYYPDYLRNCVNRIYSDVLNMKQNNTVNVDPNQQTDIGHYANRANYFSDVKWALDNSIDRKVGNQQTYINKVLGSQELNTLIKQLIDKQQKQPYSQNEMKDYKVGLNQDAKYTDYHKKASNIMKLMFSDYDPTRCMCFAYIMHKIFKQIYTQIVVNENQLNKFKLMHRENKHTPIVIIPTHRSYIDFLLMSYVMYANKMMLPHIVSADDFLKMKGVNKLMRASGAFFIKRSEMQSDILYKNILKIYIQQMLKDGLWLEFFIEGTRSRTGKMLKPKYGVLGWVAEMVLQKMLPNIIIQPVTINYERVLEAETYPMELLGEQKVKESLSRLLKAVKTLSMNFGNIYLEFGQPINLKTELEIYQQENRESVQSQKGFNRQVGKKVMEQLHNNIVVLPTNLVSTIVLSPSNRMGVSVGELNQQVMELKLILEQRKIKINYSGIQDTFSALKHLEFLITKKKDNFMMWIQTKRDYTNNILLAFYRAPIQQNLLDESLLLLALKMGPMKLNKLFNKIQLLYQIFRDELQQPQSFANIDNFKIMLDRYSVYNLIKCVNGEYQLEENQMIRIRLIVNICQSLLEGVWSFFAGLQLLEMPIKESELLHKIQFITENFQIQRNIQTVESCSLETLRIAYSYLKNSNLVSIKNKMVYIENIDQLKRVEKKIHNFVNLLSMNAVMTASL